MTTQLPQYSFAAGEISPEVYGRADLSKYHIAAKQMLNWQVLRAGGAQTRGGLRFVGECATGATIVRLIPFSYNTEQTYILEFTDSLMRVIKDGAYVLESAETITAVTQADPAVVTIAGHPYTNGQQIYIGDVNGMTELNGKVYVVANKTTNTFELQGIDSSSYTAYSSGGSSSRIYEVASPYAEADLARLKYVQTADVMYLAHPSYAPRKLSRTGHTAWTFAAISFQPSQAAPTSPSATPKTSGSESYDYRITAVAEETFEESEPVDVTAASAATLSATDYIDLAWTGASGAQKYNVYRAENGIYGYIGSTETTAFRDDYINPDLSDTPPTSRNPFSGANDYPAAVGLYQQRTFWGATNNNPQGVWTSSSANLENMNTSSPSKSEDAVTITLASEQVNEIRHFIGSKGMVFLTSGGEWAMFGDENGVIKPSAPFPEPQSGYGSSHVAPVRIGKSALFVQDDGSNVRDIAHSFAESGYGGGDLTVLSRHLFKGVERGEIKTIDEWAYQKAPDTTIWAVRSDGVCLGLTYDKEHQIVAWHRHVTDGEIESVASVREGTEYGVYFVVKRVIGGSDVRYVERLESREISRVRDAFCVDSGLTYDNPQTMTGATQANPIVVTVPGHGWSNGDEVDFESVVGMTELNGNRYRVDNVTTNTAELTDSWGDSIDGLAFNAYVSGGVARKAVNTLSGLDHLEGEVIVALVDGNVVKEYQSGGTNYLKVTDGSISLPNKGGVIHVGLPYVCDLQTMDAPLEAQGASRNYRRAVGATVHLYNSRGLKIGPSFDEDDLVEWEQRAYENYGEPIALFTGKASFDLKSVANNHGSICIRQDNPLPGTILNVVPEYQVGP